MLAVAIAAGCRYATSFDGVLIVDDSSLIHDFYTSECERPVHLVIDTALKVGPDHLAACLCRSCAIQHDTWVPGLYKNVQATSLCLFFYCRLRAAKHVT